MSRPHLSTPALLWRQLRADPGAAVAVLTVVLVAAALASLAPRALAAMGSAELHHQVAALSANDSSILASDLPDPVTGNGTAGADLGPDLARVWGRLDATLAAVRAHAESPLSAVLGPARYRVTGTPLPFARDGSADETGPLTFLSVAADPRLAPLVRVVAGAAPRTAPSADPSAPVEVMLSRESAARMSLPVGSTGLATLPDGATRVIRVSGVFVARDPAAAYWQLNPSTLTPQTLDDGNTRPSVTGTAYVDPTAYPQLRDLFVDPRARIWFAVDADSLDATEVPALIGSLHRFVDVGYFVSASKRTGLGADTAGLSLTSRLGLTLEVVRDRVAGTAVVLAICAAAPAGVLLAVLVLAVRLVTVRRRSAQAVVAARGASGAGLRVAALVEGLAIGVPAAALGVAVAAWLGPADGGRGLGATSLVAPVLVGLVPALLLVATARTRGPTAERADLGGRPRWRHRWLLEVVVVSLAVVALVLLLRRGLPVTAAVDPLLVVTPLLLGLAGCIVLLRVLPLPLAAVYRWARRRRELVAFLGSARALRDPTTGLAPVLAMVLGVAVAVSSVVLLSTVRTGVERAALSSVGADLRVSGPVFPPAAVAAAERVPGVEAAVAVDDAGTVSLQVDGNLVPAELYLTDTRALGRVQRGLPDAVVPALASAEGRVDVVLSDGLVPRSAGDVSLETADLRIRARVPSVAGIEDDAAFVVADRAAASQLVSGAYAPTTLLVRTAPDADRSTVVAGLRAATGAAGRSLLVSDPDGTAATVVAAPAVRGLQVVLLAALVVVAALLALAVALAVLLGARSRERLVAVLRVLGLSPAQARGLVAWELGPMTVAALVAGSALGVVLVGVVRAVVDLRPFTGGAQTPPTAFVPLPLVAVLGGLVLVVAAASAGAALLSRRSSPAAVLRFGAGDGGGGGG